MLVIMLVVIVSSVNTSCRSATGYLCVVMQAKGVNRACDIGLYVRFIERVGLTAI